MPAMFINFEAAGRRKLLVIKEGGGFSLAHSGTLCGRPRWKGESGQLYHGWSEYYSISNELGMRYLKRPEVRQALRQLAAWKMWDETRQLTGFGSVASAVFTAISGEQYAK